jgi:hypothetical protein
MNIRVECYSGHRGEEIPRAMWFGDRRVEVAEIIDRWLAPDHRYFKLLGADRCIYIIRHDIVTFDWQITFYQNPAIANASDGGPLSGNA